MRFCWSSSPITAQAPSSRPEIAPAEAADPTAALRPGCGVLAVFPRMAGKRRPGVVAHVTATGLVALPLTTRRTNQPGRLAMPEADLAALGFEKRSHLLLPRAAYLPRDRVLEARGAISEPLLAQIFGEMVDWYGLDWRERDPALRTPGPARLLHLRARP